MIAVGTRPGSSRRDRNVARSSGFWNSTLSALPSASRYKTEAIILLISRRGSTPPVNAKPSPVIMGTTALTPAALAARVPQITGLMV
jgi:hypothetical protein